MLSSHCKQSFILFVLTSKRCWIVELVQFLWRTIPQLSILCVFLGRGWHVYLHCVWLLVIVPTFPAQRHHSFPGDCLGHSALSSLLRDSDYSYTQHHQHRSSLYWLSTLGRKGCHTFMKTHDNTIQRSNAIDEYQMCLCFAGNTSSTRFDEKRLSYLCACLHLIFSALYRAAVSPDLWSSKVFWYSVRPSTELCNVCLVIKRKIWLRWGSLMAGDVLVLEL